ncbi:MAG TPA: DUF6265 family protein [Stenotrophobium sp.]|jgi:hypothetical protein|nr:DUF6265 family protein [Stenotrophobium sp.]
MRLLIAMLGFAISAVASAADAPRATSFGWISGCWGYASGGSSYVEHWLPATGNRILGVTSRIANGFTKDFDYVRIVTAGDGFDFIDQSQGGAERRLGMTQLKGTHVTFESLDDPSVFPYRISYEFAAPDALTEKLEGSGNGKPITVIFPMRRIACDATP